MSKKEHTPGPWVWNGKHGSLHRAGEEPYQFGASILRPTWEYDEGSDLEVSEADARLIAAAPEMLEALRLHKAWSDSENSGPDYGGQTRDTHPDGERIWRAWWNNNLDLCDRAQKATESAISKATGGAS